ncbi:hypothetical protein [Hyperthermus butylicus]|uniref:Uncharacterized protein n=1 Tax=Hyperthermus butylicus (strain DSM 5456 / JCM 9403 / PLM1-5) TaxID=415426 RepID=A2BM23_HYPBU|nr:hypothetical protein [Hyperthermus butylicus]ABM81034.1 hypothetical protein Hbut_1200 [Hyperthermus butylicus DSM 5456]
MAQGMDGIVCPRCRTHMEYRVEIEFRNGGRIVRYYYWCPRCGYRVNDLLVNIGKNGGKVRIVLEEYVARVKLAKRGAR